MIQEEIIHSLTHWIDQNLDKSLSIDEVAAKSGYSKWHLQRMFRSVTKQTLGGYIRERRLTLAGSAASDAASGIRYCDAVWLRFAADLLTGLSPPVFPDAYGVSPLHASPGGSASTPAEL